MKIIFFGTPSFAARVLQYLLDHQVNVVAVISKPDRPKGRSSIPVPTPVKVIALQHQPSIPIYQPEIVSAFEFAPILQSYEADLFVVVAYGELIKQHLLDMPRLGCINLHASLLPKYRGAAPIQRCLMNGETETGVTIMHMVKKMDAGDMIETAKVSVDPDMIFGELEALLCEVGKMALLKVISDFERGVVNEIPQDHTQATFAPKIELEECEIKWEKPAAFLHNLVRGANPDPGAWCYVRVRNEQKRLKINRTRIVSSAKALPGTILSLNQENLIVATGDQALQLLEVQLEGRKSMSSAELMRGLPLKDISFFL